MFRTNQTKKVADSTFSKETAKLLGNIAQRKVEEAFASVGQLTFGVKETKENEVKVYVADTRDKPIIGYLEFGTGMLGETFLYPKLPTEGIDFVSYGISQHTEGWQYNYAYYQGIKANPILGMYPKAYFYTAVMDLRKELSPFVKEKIKRTLEGNE